MAPDHCEPRLSYQILSIARARVQRRRFSRATWLASLQLAVARTSKWVKLRWSRKKDPFDLAGDHRDHQGPPGTTRDHKGPQGPGGSAKSKSAGSQCLEMLDMLVGFVVGWLLCRVVYSHGSHGQVNPGTHAPGRSWYWFVEKLDLNCRAALSGARWGNSLVEFS